MFETPLEGPTVVATQYGLSYCLVMFASEMPGGKQYLNMLLAQKCFKWQQHEHKFMAHDTLSHQGFHYNIG